MNEPSRRMETPLLSIIVVYYNAKNLVLSAVQSAHASAGTIPHEVIVVDNGSLEPLPEELNPDCGWLRIVPVGKNEGYAAGCNRGFEVSTGRHLLFINPDVEIRGDSIPRLVEFLEQNSRVGAVSCRIVDPGGRAVPHGFEFPSPWWSLAYALTALPARLGPVRHWLARWMVRYKSPYESHSVDWMVGCALMVRREALEQVGGWDEAYFLYAEEIDLYYRLRQVGWRAHYLSDGEIVHFGGSSSEPGAEYNFLQGYRSRYQFIEKHLGRGRAWVFRLVTAAKQSAGVLVDGLWCLLHRGDRKRRLRTLQARWKLVLISMKILE